MALPHTVTQNISICLNTSSYVAWNNREQCF